MKYFIVSDVHSFYDELINSLNEAGFDKNNQDHFFISCGDLFDRGDKPKEVLEFVMSIPFNRRCFIRGNHEDLLEQLVLGKREPAYHDYVNGTLGTIALMCDKSADTNSLLWGRASLEDSIDKLSKNKLLKQYFSELKDYYCVKKYIFTHGWLPCGKDEYGYYLLSRWKESPKSTWERARWLNGIDRANDGQTVEGKTVVCGHFHCSYGHYVYEKKGKEFGENADFSPYYGDGIIAIDSCVAYSGKINCIVI